MTRSTISSPLDDPPGELRHEPLFDETLTLLRAVRDHDFDTLAELCDDDFGIVDIAPDGNAVPIRTRAEWEAWFRHLFESLDAMGAATDSRINRYDVMVADELAYSVVEFRQTLTVGDVVAWFDCVSTIVWKRTAAGWREARWHCSVIESDVPAELQPSA